MDTDYLKLSIHERINLKHQISEMTNFILAHLKYEGVHSILMSYYKF